MIVGVPGNWKDQHLLDRMDEHTCTMYLIGQGEGVQTVKNMVDARYELWKLERI